MPTVVQFRRGTTAQNDAFTGAVGEISIDTDRDTVRIHDGSTPGGFEVLQTNLPNQTVGGNVVPDTNNTYDLGTSAAKWKDLYLSGNLSVAGNATISGNLTFGDAATDTVAFSADVASDFIPSAGSTYDIGAAGTTYAEIHGDAIYGALTGNVTGNVTGDVTGNADTATTASGVAANSVALGTGTTGNYALTIDARAGITLQGTPAEGWSPILSIEDDAIVTDMIANSAVTNDKISTNAVNLGSQTVGNYVSTGATSGNGISGSTTGETSVFTVTSNATNANTASTIVFRDGSGNFSAGTITGNLTGNVTGNLSSTGANTMASLQTTGNVIVGGDLTVSGTTTTINTETLLLADNVITVNSNEAGTPSQDGGIEVERGTSTNKTLLWDETNDRWTVGSETFVAGTFTGGLSGNATTATTLASARNIGGVSFDGSASINLPGVNAAGNQSTSGNAATATTLATGRTITLTGDVTGVSGAFNGGAALSFSTALAANTVTSTELSGAVGLTIYNSAGTAVKSLYGSGS